jgi:hypothetical protein
MVQHINQMLQGMRNEIIARIYSNTEVQST